MNYDKEKTYYDLMQLVSIICKDKDQRRKTVNMKLQISDFLENIYKQGYNDGHSDGYDDGYYKLIINKLL